MGELKVVRTDIDYGIVAIKDTLYVPKHLSDDVLYIRLVAHAERAKGLAWLSEMLSDTWTALFVSEVN